MQFNGVNKKENQHSLVVSAWGIPACTFIECELAALRGVAAYHPGSFPHPFPPSFHCLFSVMGTWFPFLCGGPWLGCQDFPAMGEVSIQELAANSESSWKFQAPNLHLVIQLVKVSYHHSRRIAKEQWLNMVESAFSVHQLCHQLIFVHYKKY